MRKPVLTLVASAAMVFAACGGSASQAPDVTGPPVVTDAPSPTPETVDLTNSKYAPEAGKPGGQILFGDWQEANQFNPFYLTGVTEANVASASSASLVVTTHDYKYAPDLATDIPTITNGGVKVPGDGGDAMTVTWTLKDGLQWSDGQPLTCDDFAFTWAWVMDPANVGLAGGTVGYEEITKIDCPSPTSIVEHFKSIYEGYIGISTPLAKHYLKDIPMADQVKGAGYAPADMPKVPVSGAFKFESVTSGQEVRLVRNDLYKGFKSGVPAYLDTLVFKWYGDPVAMIAGYVAGEVDIITNLLNADIPTLDAQGLKAETSVIPSLTYEYEALNWADGSKIDPGTGVGGCSRNPAVQDRGTGCPVSDPQFRLALSYAINKGEINDRILGGTSPIASTNVAPDAYFFDPSVTAAAFDLEKAKSILDTAGWVVGADGIRAKNGLRAKIELCSTTRQVRIDTVKLVAEQLKAAGIEGVPNNVAASDQFADFNSATVATPCNIYHGLFDMAEFASSVPIDPIANYSSYHSSQFEPIGSNLAQVSDPDLDKALETVKTTVDFVEVKRAMATFQKIYVDKVLEIPLYFRPEIEVVKPTVGNFFANPTSAGPTWNAVDWYVKG